MLQGSVAGRGAASAKSQEVRVCGNVRKTARRPRGWNGVRQSDRGSRVVISEMENSPG